MNECIPVEELGALDKLPADDPRVRHVAACPRCSSLAFAHDEFIRAQSVEGADPWGADAHLARFIAERVESTPVEATRPSGGPRRGRGRWNGFALWRPGLVAAMLIVTAVAVLRWQPWVSDEIVYRGEGKTSFTGLHAFDADGTVWLWFDAIKEADDYRVIILSEDLRELAELKPIIQRVNDRSGVPDGLAAECPRDALPATARYWQVTALVEGGVLLSSDPQPLP